MRVILDTNQLVRALLRLPELATLLMTWEVRRFTVVCSVELLADDELIRLV